MLHAGHSFASLISTILLLEQSGNKFFRFVDGVDMLECGLKRSETAGDGEKKFNIVVFWFGVNSVFYYASFCVNLPTKLGHDTDI